MAYDSTEIAKIAYATLIDGVVSKLVFVKNDGSYFPVSITPDALATSESGLLDDRPAAGQVGKFYFASDDGSGCLYRDNGVGWEQITPRGVIGVARLASYAPAISAGYPGSDVVGLAASATVRERPIKLRAYVNLVRSLAGTMPFITLNEGATQIAFGSLNAGSTADQTLIVESFPFVASPGVHTYKTKAGIVSGGGNVVVSGVATAESFLEVIEL